jgi:hypothetical protein
MGHKAPLFQLNCNFLRGEVLSLQCFSVLIHYYSIKKFMKRSLTLAIVILCSIFLTSTSFAQDTILARIVYTNNTRDAILAKTVGVNQVDTLFQSAGTVTLRNLAVLASTRDGKTILIGGKGVFMNPINNALDSAWAIARIDAPFKNTGFFNPITLTLGGAKILKIIFSDQSNNPFDRILPIGVLSPDEKSWYATPTKTSGGEQQWFFHGNLDGSGTVDSIQVTGSYANSPDHTGYHMTNLITSDDASGSTMLCVVFDGISGINSRAQIFQWTPNVPSGSVAFQGVDITGALIQSTRPTLTYVDSIFGYCLHNLGGGTCELALLPTAKGDITFYTFPISGTIDNFGKNGNHAIARSVLPNGSDGKPLRFFTGTTAAIVPPDHDVFTSQAGLFALGNGGDMMFNAAGDSVVFITSRSDDYSTSQESGIYIYSFTSHTLTLVQNDPNAWERQPVFTAPVVHKYVPPPPPPFVPGIAILDSTAINFGIDTIGNSPIQVSVDLKDTSASLIIIKSAVITNTNGGIFSLISPTSFPINVQPRSSQVFLLRFTPTTIGQYSTSLVIHYTDTMRMNEGKPDSILTLPLSGAVVKRTTGSVHTSAPSSFDLSIVPNPFSAITKITVTAREAGSSSLEIRDLLGKEIYSSKSFELGPGETYSYTFDASAMHLSPGSYFIIVRSHGEELTRQTIFVK